MSSPRDVNNSPQSTTNNTSGSSLGTSKNASFSHQMPQTYANRAASAIKASGLAQRFGKAIYGSGNNSSGNNTNSSSNAISPHNTLRKAARLASAENTTSQFEARSGILAMGMSPDRTQAAIAGKDFFQILDVDNDIQVSKDLRQSRETRDFDKMFAVTSLKWGHQLYNHHVALATSGGNILLYDLTNPSAKPAVTEYKDNNRCINTLAFNRNTGHVLLSGTNDGSIKVWDLRTNGKRPSLTFAKGGDSAREVQCSPHDAKKLAVIYDSGIIQRWDIRNPKACDKRMSAHTSVGLSLDWHPEYDYIVSGGRDKLIQVWNMGKESRDADCVILAPSAVSKVRWQVDSNASIHSKNAVSGALNTCIASCGRSKYDYCTYIWNPRRPFIPVNVLEQHSDSISEIQWKNDKMLWTTSRDRQFMQQNLATEPLMVDNVASQAFTWSPCDDDMTFMVQDKYRDQFGSVYNYRLSEDADFTTVDDSSATAMGASSSIGSRRRAASSVGAVSRRPGSSSYRAQNRPINDIDYNQAVCFASFSQFDPQIFEYMADNYLVTARDGETLPDLCEINSKVAASCGKYRTAQTWLVLKNAMLWETERYNQFKAEELKKSSGVNLTSGSRLIKPFSMHLQAGGGGVNPNQSTSTIVGPSSKITEGFKSINSNDSTTKTATNTPVVTSPSLEEGKKSKAALVASSKPSTPLPISTDMAEEDQDESDNSTVPPMPVPDTERATSGLANEIVNSNSSPPDNATGVFSSYGTIGSSPESYPAHAKQSFHRKGSAAHMGRTGASQKGPADSSSHQFTSTNQRPSFSTSVSTDSYWQNSFGSGQSSLDGGAARAGTRVSTRVGSSAAGVGGGGLGISNLQLDSSEYKQFLNSLNHPWTASNLIRKTAEYAMEEGDVQLCAVLGVLFKKFYAEAFPSDQTVEEWVLCYIDMLKRNQLFTAAAEIIKNSEFESVRTLALTETQIDTLCHRCMSSLQEHKPAEGYWSCSQCKRLLDGCIICRQPVKGLASALIECGHKIHVSCMKEWLFDFGMLECPSGCGAVIVN